MENCGTCKYFEPGVKDPSVLVLPKCLRYPPQVYWDHDLGILRCEFPNVVESEWCGEWALKPSN